VIPSTRPVATGSFAQALVDQRERIVSFSLGNVTVAEIIGRRASKCRKPLRRFGRVTMQHYTAIN
jgi:hypothetical protein